MVIDDEIKGEIEQCSINPVQYGLFPSCPPIGVMGKGYKKVPLPKICKKYPTMMKIGTLIPYLNLKILKLINHVTHPLTSADMNIFSPEIIKFYYINKYVKRIPV